MPNPQMSQILPAKRRFPQEPRMQPQAGTPTAGGRQENPGYDRAPRSPGFTEMAASRSAQGSGGQPVSLTPQTGQAPMWAAMQASANGTVGRPRVISAEEAARRAARFSPDAGPSGGPAAQVRGPWVPPQGGVSQPVTPAGGGFAGPQGDGSFQSMGGLKSLLGPQNNSGNLIDSEKRMNDRFSQGGGRENYIPQGNRSI